MTIRESLSSQNLSNFANMYPSTSPILQEFLRLRYFCYSLPALKDANLAEIRINGRVSENRKRKECSQPSVMYVRVMYLYILRTFVFNIFLRHSRSQDPTGLVMLCLTLSKHFYDK